VLVALDAALFAASTFPVEVADVLSALDVLVELRLADGTGAAGVIVVAAVGAAACGDAPSVGIAEAGGGGALAAAGPAF
jgi:hypothetical protein